MKYILFFISMAAITLYLGIFLILISKNFVFDGKAVYSYDFENESPFISLLKPRGRVDQQLYRDTFGDYYQTIKIDPVYFDVELPRHFENLKLGLKYKNPYEPLLEVGVSRGEDDPNFNLKPVENKLIDKLIEDSRWTKIQEGNTLLLQKKNSKKTVDSIEKFLNNIPGDKKVATYNYLLPTTFNIPNYKSKNGVIVNKSLRGSHSMYTYLGVDEKLDISFNFHDMNRGNNSDEIEITVLKNDKVLKIFNIEDDGIADDSSAMAAPIDFDLIIPNPGQGVYKIELITTDDIFTRQINSAHDYLVFEKEIYLGDNVSYLNDKTPNRNKATQLFTTSERLNAITSHKEAFQEVKFLNKIIDVDTKHILFSETIPLSKREKWLVPVTTPKNDIKFIGDGLFAFEESQFFDPNYLEISGDPELDLDFFNVGYLIATYNPPAKNGEWKQQFLDFDLEAIRDADNEYRFVISFPFNGEQETVIDISDISLHLESKPIDLKTFKNKIINRIKLLF